MAERQIKIRGFTYTADLGEGRTIRRFATRGAKVDLNAEDVKRGEEIDAFGDPNEVPDPDEVSSEVEFTNVVDMSDDELDVWLEEDSPPVKEVIAAAEDDPESAVRLLDAEKRVTDGDPRKGVLDGLTKIIEAE
jgi:hypothetical protein